MSALQAIVLILGLALIVSAVLLLVLFPALKQSGEVDDRMESQDATRR